MIMQIINIVSGFLLAVPKMKEWGGRESLEKIETTLNQWRAKIGMLSLILGLLALVQRLGIVSLPIPEFGASFPQALPAIMAGLLLWPGLREKNAFLAKVITALAPYEIPLGFLGIAVGIGSLLFGCFLPVFCGPRYF